MHFSFLYILVALQSCTPDSFTLVSSRQFTNLELAVHFHQHTYFASNSLLLSCIISLTEQGFNKPRFNSIPSQFYLSTTRRLFLLDQTSTVRPSLDDNIAASIISIVKAASSGLTARRDGSLALMALEKDAREWRSQ